MCADLCGWSERVRVSLSLPRAWSTDPELAGLSSHCDPTDVPRAGPSPPLTSGRALFGPFISRTLRRHWRRVPAREVLSAGHSLEDLAPRRPPGWEHLSGAPPWHMRVRGAGSRAVRTGAAGTRAGRLAPEACREPHTQPRGHLSPAATLLPAGWSGSARPTSGRAALEDASASASVPAPEGGRVSSYLERGWGRLRKVAGSV